MRSAITLQPCKSIFNPRHREFREIKNRLEHREHDEKEDDVSEYFVRDDIVDLLRNHRTSGSFARAGFNVLTDDPITSKTFFCLRCGWTEPDSVKFRSPFFIGLIQTICT